MWLWCCLRARGGKQDVLFGSRAALVLCARAGGVVCRKGQKPTPIDDARSKTQQTDGRNGVATALGSMEAR